MFAATALLALLPIAGLGIDLPSRPVVAGDALVARVQLADGLEAVEAQATWRGRRYRLYPEPGGLVPVLLPTALDQNGDHRLVVDLHAAAAAGGDSERLSVVTDVPIAAYAPPVRPQNDWAELTPDDRALARRRKAETEHAELIEILERLGGDRALPRRFDGSFQPPLRGAVVGDFGIRRALADGGDESPFHLGVDYSRRRRTSVHAPAAGVVHAVRVWPLLGETVIVEHGAGVVTLYAHLDIALVAAGDELKRDAVLGWTGDSGLSDGAMLHQAAFIHGEPVNPRSLEHLPRWLRSPPNGEEQRALRELRPRFATPPPAPTQLLRKPGPRQTTDAASTPAPTPALDSPTAATTAANSAPTPLRAIPRSQMVPGPSAVVADPRPTPTASPTVSVTRPDERAGPETAPSAQPSPAPTLDAAAPRADGDEDPEAFEPAELAYLDELHGRLTTLLAGHRVEVRSGPKRLGTRSHDLVVALHGMTGGDFQAATQRIIQVVGETAPEMVADTARLTIVNEATKTSIPLLVADARSYWRARRGSATSSP